MTQFADTLEAEIRALIAQKGRAVIAIDGSCTAGKTTLAADLAGRFDCRVIHMDDFFLRPEQRTPERFATPGGNIDHERFSREVLPGLLSGDAITFSPFDCGTFRLESPVSLEPRPLTLVEGTYCLHPAFGSYWDLAVFLDISPEQRRRRILERPAFLHRRFFEEWIPMEQLYFGTFHIPAKCRFRFHTP